MEQLHTLRSIDPSFDPAVLLSLLTKRIEVSNTVADNYARHIYNTLNTSYTLKRRKLYRFSIYDPQPEEIIRLFDDPRIGSVVIDRQGQYEVGTFHSFDSEIVADLNYLWQLECGIFEYQRNNKTFEVLRRPDGRYLYTVPIPYYIDEAYQQAFYLPDELISNIVSFGDPLTAHRIQQIGQSTGVYLMGEVLRLAPWIIEPLIPTLQERNVNINTISVGVWDQIKRLRRVRVSRNDHGYVFEAREDLSHLNDIRYPNLIQELGYLAQLHTLGYYTVQTMDTLQLRDGKVVVTFTLPIL